MLFIFNLPCNFAKFNEELKYTMYQIQLCTTGLIGKLRYNTVHWQHMVLDTNQYVSNFNTYIFFNMPYAQHICQKLFNTKMKIDPLKKKKKLHFKFVAVVIYYLLPNNTTVVMVSDFM